MDKIYTLKARYGDELVGELTEKLDERLADAYKNIDFTSYLLKYSDELYAIRYPGATRGYIKVKNGVITEVEFYKDTSFGKIGCYKESIKELIPELIGSNLICTTKETI